MAMIASAAVALLMAAVPAMADNSGLAEGSAGSFLSSRFARQSGDIDQAADFLNRTVGNNPKNAAMLSQLLALQISVGDMKAALATAERLRKLKSADPLSGLLLTIEKVHGGQFDEAYKTLSESFDGSGGQLWLPLVEGWIEAGAKKPAQAMSLEEMPIAVGRTAAIISYHLALINEYNGFHDAAALAFAEAAADQAATSQRVIQHLKKFLAAHPGKYNKKETSPVDLETIIAEYSELFSEELPPLESAVATPADGIAEILYTMGVVMQMAGITQDATAYLQMAHYLRPDFYSATYSLAELLADGKSYVRADALLKSIPKNSRYSLKAELKRGSFLNRAGRHQEAVSLFNQLVVAYPTAAEPWIAKGDSLRARKLFTEAAEAYSEAIALSGVASGKDWPVFYARGACYERLGKWNQAREDLKKALELNPNQPDVLNYLAYGMIIRGEDLLAASEMLEKAIAQKPDDPQIVDSMGWALHLLGQYDAALNHLERAVEMLPNDATVNDHLGDNYWRLGRKKEAVFQWKKALSYRPDEAELKKINAKLSSGLPEITTKTTQSPQTGENSSSGANEISASLPKKTINQ